MGTLANTIKKALIVTGAAMVLALTAVLLRGQSVQAAAGGDCSDNSIIRCGVSSPADLIAKANANNPNDLQAVYASFDLPTSQYTNFSQNAKMGVARLNGDIVVNGQVVARDAWSIGRTKFSYSTPYQVGSTTYYKSKNTDVLKQDNLPAMVYFDNNGKLVSAILAPCGNPMGGNSVVPSYACNQLNKTAVAGQENTYSFTTTAPAATGATVSRVVYDFGDGTTETRTNPTEAVTHTFAGAGDHTAKVTVYFKLSSGQEVSASGAGCATVVTVKAPTLPPAPKAASWQCTALTADRRDNGQYAFTFRATASRQNARLVSADFNFGDNTPVVNVPQSAADNNVLAVDHTYAAAGTYTATATLHFQADDGSDAQGKAADVNCTVNVSIAQPAAPILPKTGPAGVAGIFAGASALGTLGYRWRSSRRLTKVNRVVDNLLKR